MESFVIIGIFVASIAILTYVLVKQNQRMNQLEKQIATKKDDVAPYLELLGKIPAENWNDFMRNPAQVARALGLVVEEHALSRYNAQRIQQLLVAARKARKNEIYYAGKDDYYRSDAAKCGALANNYERQARELDQQQRLAR